MSERTYKIADAILDSTQEEYRSYNLENAERVADYAYNGMDIVIGDEEAEAILTACREYLAIIEADDFDGEGRLAWDRTIGALRDFETRGGKREGAGRKPTDTFDTKVRLTATQRETLKNLGGSAWLQKELDKMEGFRTIDTADLSEEEQEQFIDGWESVGGYTDDLDESPAPWCCPWYHGNTVITVKGGTPQEWGADWWSQCKDEIEEELANETSEE